jgi:hypothetical protein
MVGRSPIGVCSWLLTLRQGRGKLLELAALKDRDPTHILFRRHVECGNLCMDLEANFLERDAIVLRQMVESGDKGLEECHERFMARLGRFCKAFCSFFRSVSC